jgi:lactate permease
MNEISLNFWNWLLAFTPIVIILVLMLWRRWGASKAGGFALLVTLLIAWLRFGAPFELLAYAQVKALLLALDVLWIIWNALILFHLTRQAGAIDKIGRTLSNLTPDRTLQALILGWVFPSFLQGMDGFGIPVAVSAPLLISLGFTPIHAVLITSIGHSWAVTFGSMASSFQILIAVTGLPGEVLAPFSLLLLGVACYVCGLIVAYLSDGWAGLKRNFSAILILAIVMAVTQYVVATYIVYNLAATLAGVMGLLASLAITGWQSRKNRVGNGNVGKDLVSAFSSYIILVGIALIINLVPPIKTFLSQVQITLNFPAVETSLGWLVPAGSGRILKPFSHPGSIILYASVASYFLFKRFHLLPKGSLKSVFQRLASAAEKSSAGIITMVTLSVVMTDSGMNQLLAVGLSQSVGVLFYPLAAPLIGALGAFITGSNSNANVLFAVLQMNTAQLLNISVPLILAAQTAGGALGSVISPAKVIVGCSTVGLSGEEGRVMPKILLYGLIPIMTVGLLAFLLQWLAL